MSIDYWIVYFDEPQTVAITTANKRAFSEKAAMFISRRVAGKVVLGSCVLVPHKSICAPEAFPPAIARVSSEEKARLVTTLVCRGYSPKSFPVCAS